MKESQGFLMWRGVLGKNSLRAQGIAPKSFRVEASLKFDISCVGGACVWHVEWLFYTLQRKKYMTMIYAKYVLSSKGLWAAWTVLSCTLQPECRHWIHSRLLSYFKFTEKKNRSVDEFSFNGLLAGNTHRNKKTKKQSLYRASVCVWTINKSTALSLSDT